MTLATHGTPRTVLGNATRARRSASATPVKPTVALATSNKRTTVITITLPGSRVGSATTSSDFDRLRSRVERLVGGLYATTHAGAKLERLVERLEKVAAEKPTADQAAVRTKAALATVGVNSVEGMRTEIQRIAGECQRRFASVARELFEQGLKTFDQRLWNESSNVVLSSFKEAYAGFEHGTATQWSLRVPRQSHLKALLLAQEYGVSQSLLACWCIASAIEAQATA